MILKVIVVAAAALALAVPAAACTHPKTSLSYLEGQIMCPTCHTTLDMSEAPAAQQIKAQISKRIAQCWSARQIEDELVGNFGQGILAAPPHKGFDLLAWWLPIGGVLGGAALLAAGVWRWSRTRETEASSNSLLLDPETDRQIDELLARMD